MNSPDEPILPLDQTGQLNKTIDTGGSRPVLAEDVGRTTHEHALTVLTPVDDPLVAAAIQKLHDDRESGKKNGRETIIERTSPQDDHFFVIKRDSTTGREIERRRFSIVVLSGPKDAVFEPSYKLMQERFGENELDPKEIMQDQMKGLRKGFESMGTRAQIISIKDDRGEVVCTLNGGLLPLLDEEGQQTGESIFMVFYVATDPKVEGIGIGREAMITAYQVAAQEAKDRRLRLIGCAGECTYTSKRYWENLGWRRAYTQDERDDVSEVPYVQPPLDFDLETGEIAEGCGDAPEHFMVRLFDGAMVKDPNIARTFARIVAAFYRANNFIDRRAFEGVIGTDKPDEVETAYQRHRQAIVPHLEQFTRDVMRGRIVLLSGAECAALQIAGKKVTHHLTPDEMEEKKPAENL